MSRQSLKKYSGSGIMRKIAILGSTGSIGTQTLTIVDWHPQSFQVELISANKNVQLLEQQIEKYRPTYAVVLDEEAAEQINISCLNTKTKLYVGMEGLLEALEKADYNLVVTALSGAAGIEPTITAINQKADIALANKETLVAAGEIVMKLAKEKNVNIIPVDSEHSAIFQCLRGEKLADVNKLILTASGGPFRGFKREQLTNILPEDALKHPKWDMGMKISIDSATLMNKGLEVIEARWLFGISGENIDVIVHPQSIIHSMVQYNDGSIIAQLGPTDMKIPIQYALTYPLRGESQLEKLDITKIRQFTFETPNTQVFPALTLAYQALEKGGTMPAVLNAANEVAVSLFLNREISFLEITQLVKTVIGQHKSITNPDLKTILEVDRDARILAKQYAGRTVG